MGIFVNKTSRAIVIGGHLLVPGERRRIDNAGKLKALYPRFAEMLDKGDIVSYSTKDASESLKNDSFEVKTETAADDEPKPIQRRKRV